MRIIIKATNLDISADHRESIQQRIKSVCSRTRDAIQTVTVTLSDINGPKGGRDKQVKVKLKSDNLPILVVVELKSNWFAAVNSALMRINSSLLRKLKRKSRLQKQPILLPNQLAVS